MHLNRISGPSWLRTVRTAVFRLLEARPEQLLARVLALSLAVALISGALGGCTLPGADFFNDGQFYKDPSGIKMLSRTSGENLQIYENGAWKDYYWIGIDLGNTIPGCAPGEMGATYKDYRQWFKGMEELGIRLVRVYTILSPDFYQALYDHNESASEKMLLVQGIWPPEDALLADNNAMNPDTVDQFDTEITNAVGAVYGDVEIPQRRGHAGGKYTADVSPYLFAWMLGFEWEPVIVMGTNSSNPDSGSFEGRFFKASAGASPFEAWLAARCDKLAELENARGWQHPVSFVNWPTTDPMTHPNEPKESDDIVSVDPNHVAPTDNWKAGYFSAFHIYPYYPDMMSYEVAYQQYRNAEGKPDPYEAYVKDLKEHLPGIPLVVSEFGMPSSRGLAHYGPLGRNQGMHTEVEQGNMLVGLIDALENAGCAGAIIFEWSDEWFKLTWNTVELEIPGDRRPMWHNMLTNEECFGLVAAEAGNVPRIYLDGDSSDWKELPGSQEITWQDRRCVLFSDEAYLYMLIESGQPWDWSKEKLVLGFDNQEGGNRTLFGSPITFQKGDEFMLEMSGPDQATLKVAAAYDPYVYNYAYRLKYFAWDPAWGVEDNGLFLPWKLPLARPLTLPQTREQIPMQDFEVGALHSGRTNPQDPEYNHLADFCTGDRVIELRIPWMMLGYTDPSSHTVWGYHYRPENITVQPYSTAKSPGLNIEALTVNGSGAIVNSSPLMDYTWDNWEVPSYHERYKKSYYIIQDYLKKRS